MASSVMTATIMTVTAAPLTVKMNTAVMAFSRTVRNVMTATIMTVTAAPLTVKMNTAVMAFSRTVKSAITALLTVCGDDAICTMECTCEPTGGGEGCTPGYWKQMQHFGSWTAPYMPSTMFSDVFDDAFPGKTLLQVLWQGGGGLKALGRHTVAALLNAASTDVSYDMSVDDVIDSFNAVYPGGDYEALKDDFAYFNEQGCPLGRADLIELFQRKK